MSQVGTDISREVHEGRQLLVLKQTVGAEIFQADMAARLLIGVCTLGFNVSCCGLSNGVSAYGEIAKAALSRPVQIDLTELLDHDFHLC